jgi:hypothetical protein
VLRGVANSSRIKMQCDNGMLFFNHRYSDLGLTGSNLDLFAAAA